MQVETNAGRVIVVYERVSSDRQDISRQETQRERAAFAYPDREIVVIQDDGVSAYKISIFERRGGKELCDLIECGRVEAIFADAQDRLSRGRQSEWWNFADLCEQNATRIFIDGRELRFGDEGDEMKSALDAMIARRESREKGHRVKGGKRRSVERGRRNGGPRPFGYKHARSVVDDVVTSSLEIVPAEAEALRTMFIEYARGKSQADIARDLNDAGIRTVRGTTWTQSAVARMLRNPLYRGMVRYEKELFRGRYHEAIVSDELWYEVEALRAAATRHGSHAGGRPPKGSHLLTGGLLRCACGGAMRARTEQKGYGTWEAYLCDGRHSGRTHCTLPAQPRDEIDNAVWAYFEDAGLDVDAMVREGAERRSLELTDLASRVAEAERELAKATEQTERVEADYLAGTLSASRYERLIGRCESEYDAAVSALELLRNRRHEVEVASTVADADAETRHELQAIREALAGLVTGAADLSAARRALGRLFESFTLHRYGDEPVAEIIDADLAAADWYIVPKLRTDAILSPLVIGCDAGGEPVVEQEQRLARVPVDARKQRASQR
jgi:DNA invertase Pin-like site-specific DNA recombinase